MMLLAGLIPHCPPPPRKLYLNSSASQTKLCPNGRKGGELQDDKMSALTAPHHTRLNDDIKSGDSQNVLASSDAIVAVFNRTSPNAQPSSVRKAQAHLDSKVAKPYKTVVVESLLGQSLWTEAAGVCAAGALDEHSEELFRRGSSVFEKGPMPKTTDYIDWTSVNLDEAHRGQACELLQESLHDVLESFQQWSQAGVEAAAARCVHFFENFLNYLKLMNIAG